MSYEFTRPRTSVAINLSSAVRNSAATLCCHNDVRDRGGVAVIGLIKQVHSYEPDLRRPKADVEEGVRIVLFK
jgi:hypothetical protein